MPRTGRTRWADLQPLVGTLTAMLANYGTNFAAHPPERYRQVSFGATSPLQTWRQA